MTKPRIITLCGSTRFREKFNDINRQLTFIGVIVLAPGVFGGAGDELTEAEKVALDELHLRKIDLSDEICVINVGGYIGESTRREIEYAERIGVTVDYLEPVL